jgi:hypothetical protein
MSTLYANLEYDPPVSGFSGLVLRASLHFTTSKAHMGLCTAGRREFRPKISVNGPRSQKMAAEKITILPRARGAPT